MIPTATSCSFLIPTSPGRTRARERRVLAAIAFGLLSGCGPRDGPAAMHRTDSAGITIVESSAPAWDASHAWRIDGPIISIGSVDGPPERQLHRVRGVGLFAVGRVFVANVYPPEIRF